MKEPFWLDRVFLEAIHAALLREHGGQLGIRDSNLIESALARAKNKWEYEPESDLADLAAAYGFGLVKNHGFLDGNKRIAFMAIYVFLAMNGRELKASETEVVNIITGAADGSIVEDELAAWIRNNLIRYRS
jgi:death on curing protein